MSNSSPVTTSADSQPSLRVGVIGAGPRGASYFRHLPPDIAVKIVAIADPDAAQRAAFAELFAADHQPQHYDDGLELLGAEDLDAVVIASPNAHHARYATEAMARSIPLILEKPVATTIDDLAALWSAHENHDPGHTVVGFTLRYTNFYTQVREIVQSGRLGEILSVEANENLGTKLTMVMYRGWRQDTATSGGWMVEKCCHDFDILNHILDSRPARVFSMASALHLRPRPESEQLARFQPDASTGEFDFGDAATANATLVDTAWHSPYAPSQLPDRQVATLEYENGTMATFTAVMAQPQTNRRIRIFGTEGHLDGDIVAGSIRISTSDPDGGPKPDVEEITVTAAPGGHHGGDTDLGDTFWHLAAGDERVSRAGLAEGIEAVLTSIAVQQSAETGQPVQLDDLRRQVFTPQPVKQ